MPPSRSVSLPGSPSGHDPGNTVRVPPTPVDRDRDHGQSLLPRTVAEVGVDGLRDYGVSETGRLTDTARQSCFYGLVGEALRLFELLHGARPGSVVVAARVGGLDRPFEHAYHGYDGDREDYYRHRYLYEGVA